MLGDRSRLIKTFVACDFLEQLRSANQQITGEPARVESFDYQFEQSRIAGEQFKKQAAQAVRFDEPDKLIQCRIRVCRLGHLLEKSRTELGKHLFGSRGNMRCRSRL